MWTLTAHGPLICKCKVLSTLATIVAEFGNGDNLATVAQNGRPKRRQSPFSVTVAIFGDSRRIRRQSPFSVTVAEFGDYSRQCGQPGLSVCN